MPQEPETYTFPIGVTLGADQASHFNFGEPVLTEVDAISWQDRLRQRLVTAWCVVTDHEVLGPYESFEEADGLLNEGMAGDVFEMRYQ